MGAVGATFDYCGPALKPSPSRGGLGGDGAHSVAAQVEHHPQLNPPLEGEDFRAQKKPACAGLFVNIGSNSGECFDMPGQAALMARRLVLVDQATAGIAIHHRLGGLVRGFSAGLVFRRNGVDDFLDRRAQHGTRAGIARIALDSLTRTLFGGFDVGQGETPVAVTGGGKRPSIVGIPGLCVNERVTEAQVSP